MTITIRLKTGNDAMQDRYQAAEALRRAVERIEQDERHGIILDENGNGVGQFTVNGSSETW